MPELRQEDGGPSEDGRRSTRRLSELRRRGEEADLGAVLPAQGERLVRHRLRRQEGRGGGGGEGRGGGGERVGREGREKGGRKDGEKVGEGGGQRVEGGGGGVGVPPPPGPSPCP